jgi:hypothetical protein
MNDKETTHTHTHTNVGLLMRDRGKLEYIGQSKDRKKKHQEYQLEIYNSHYKRFLVCSSCLKYLSFITCFYVKLSARMQFGTKYSFYSHVNVAESPLEGFHQRKSV